jgi:hypothetical protein
MTAAARGLSGHPLPDLVMAGCAGDPHLTHAPAALGSPRAATQWQDVASLTSIPSAVIQFRLGPRRQQRRTYPGQTSPDLRQCHVLTVAAKQAEPRRIGRNPQVTTTASLTFSGSTSRSSLVVIQTDSLKSGHLPWSARPRMQGARFR